MITMVAFFMKKGLTMYELEAGLALDTIIEMILLCVAVGWL